MATNPNPTPTGDAWVASLVQPAPPERFLWCDECHYWHGEVNECPYTDRIGITPGQVHDAR